MTQLPAPLIPAPARGAFRAVQAVSETAAARLAERWFFTPPRAVVPPEARALLALARRTETRFDGRPLVSWEWGDGPAVYLVHGWGSRGGRLAAFVPPLRDAGFRVVAFDAPGHGESGRGLSSMPEFARALGVVAERHGAAHGIIAHSLGASATALAARWGLRAGRFALLAPPGDPAAFADAFAAALGARPDVMLRMRANSQRRLRFDWRELDVYAAAAGQSAPLLVVHDTDDGVVPFASGAAVADAWPGARLVRTSGLGHRGVTRDPATVRLVAEFVAGAALPSGEGAQLERELFYRDTR